MSIYTKLEDNPIEINAKPDYDIGDIICTSTNENPAGRLEGTWELYNKEFKQQEISDNSDAPSGIVDPLVLSRYEAYFAYKPNSVWCRMLLENSSALTDTQATLCTIDLTRIGFSGTVWGQRICGYSDAGNCILMFNNNANGEIICIDAINADGTHNCSAGSTIYVTWEWNATGYNYLLDDFCNKFYFRRIA